MSPTGDITIYMPELVTYKTVKHNVINENTKVELRLPKESKFF